MSKMEMATNLPPSWVSYLIQSERRLFILAAACKTVYSASLIGVTMLVLAMIDLSNPALETSFKYPELFAEQLKFCFWFLLLAAVYCFSSQGNSYFAAQLAGRVKARLAALVTEYAILRGSPDASERALALTLASSDAHVVCEGALQIHELWLAPINIFTVVILLIQRSGFASPWGYVGGGMCLAVLLLMSQISILLVRSRKAVSEAEVKQAAVFVEVLENIRTLRFYGWDTYMLNKLHALTDAMQPLRRKLIVLKMMNIGTSFIVSPLMVYVLISSFAFTTGQFNPTTNFLFLVQSLFDITKYALLALPSAVRACSAAAAAYERITDYFKRPTYEDRRRIHDLPSNETKATGGFAVQLVNVPCGPSSVIEQWCAEAGSLWVLQGPVRSFKTTLLETIAGCCNLGGLTCRCQFILQVTTP
jgi:ABC-type multidrug transport system fused ATPase/permease subunit